MRRCAAISGAACAGISAAGRLRNAERSASPRSARWAFAPVRAARQCITRAAEKRSVNCSSERWAARTASGRLCDSARICSSCATVTRSALQAGNVNPRMIATSPHVRITYPSMSLPKSGAAARVAPGPDRPTQWVQRRPDSAAFDTVILCRTGTAWRLARWRLSFSGIKRQGRPVGRRPCPWSTS